MDSGDGCTSLAGRTKRKWKKWEEDADGTPAVHTVHTVHDIPRWHCTHDLPSEAKFHRNTNPNKQSGARAMRGLPKMKNIFQTRPLSCPAIPLIHGHVPRTVHLHQVHVPAPSTIRIRIPRHDIPPVRQALDGPGTIISHPATRLRPLLIS